MAAIGAAKVLEKSVEMTRGIGGSEGGVLLAFDERGRKSGRGITSWVDCGWSWIGADSH